MNIELQKIKGKNNERYKKILKRKITKSEKIVFDILKEKGIKFKFQKGFWTIKGKYKGYHCIVDFYIPALRLVIEVDGKYHEDKLQKRKDTFRDEWLLRIKKVYVLRIKNCDVKKIIKKINNFLYYKNGNRKRLKYIQWEYWESKK